MVSLFDLVQGTQLSFDHFNFNSLRFVKRNLKSRTNSAKPRRHGTIKGWTESELLERGVFSGTHLHGSFVGVKFSSVRLGSQVKLDNEPWSFGTQQNDDFFLNVLDLRPNSSSVNDNIKKVWGKSVVLLGDNTTVLVYITHWGCIQSWTATGSKASRRLPSRSFFNSFPQGNSDSEFYFRESELHGIRPISPPHRSLKRNFFWINEYVFHCRSRGMPSDKCFRYPFSNTPSYPFQNLQFRKWIPFFLNRRELSLPAFL